MTNRIDSFGNIRLDTFGDNRLSSPDVRIMRIGVELVPMHTAFQPVGVINIVVDTVRIKGYAYSTLEDEATNWLRDEDGHMVSGIATSRIGVINLGVHLVPMVNMVQHVGVINVGIELVPIAPFVTQPVGVINHAIHLVSISSSSQPVGVINIGTQLVPMVNEAVGSVVVVVTNTGCATGTIVDVAMPPATAGNLIVITVINAPVNRLTVDSFARSTPFTAVASGAAGRIEMLAFVAQGGEAYYRLQSDQTQWFVIISEIFGDAHIPPYVMTSAAAAPGFPVTPSWTAEGTGLVLGVATTLPAATLTEPAGWDEISLGSAVCGMSYSYSSLPITTAGSQAPESYLGSSTGDTLNVVLPLYRIGLRVRPADTFASNAGGQSLLPGHVEPPPTVTPIEPPIPPLAPDASTPDVPLPPWVPQPGPYRS